MTDDPTVDPAEPIDPQDPTDPVDPADPIDPTDPVDEPEAFNEKQLQQMYSAAGRIISKQIDEKIAPLIQERQPASPAPARSADEMTKFNEEITEQFFGGDPTGAFKRMMEVHQSAQSNITSAKKVETDRAITQFSDDPLYKDIYQDMKKIAHTKVSEGYPPAAAAELALAQAKANLYESKDPDAANLSMSPGGQQRRLTKAAKLRPEFKKAAKRDIDKGLFKDEADYIANLSPQVRAKAVV